VKPWARRAGAEPAGLARASRTGMPPRGAQRALDYLCNPLDPLAPGTCYVVYIGRLHSPSAGSGHCCSADSSDSGPAAGLRPDDGVSEAPAICSCTSPRSTPTRQQGAVIRFRADRIDGPSALRIPRKATKCLPAGESAELLVPAYTVFPTKLQGAPDGLFSRGSLESNWFLNVTAVITSLHQLRRRNPHVPFRQNS
jgi:hypothetical protein